MPCSKLARCDHWGAVPGVSTRLVRDDYLIHRAGSTYNLVAPEVDHLESFGMPYVSF